MDAAEAAFLRLCAVLARLGSDTDRATPSLPKGAARRQNALNALQRHAAAVIAKFAFVDGAAVTGSDDAVLSAFYPDPNDGVWARYCWALLASGREHSIGTIIDATRREHDAFLLKQRSSPAKQSDALSVVEAGHADRADRLAYCYALLWRVSVVEHHIASGAQPTASEAAKAAEASEAAADTLRAIRRARLASKRARRPPPK